MKSAWMAVKTVSISGTSATIARSTRFTVAGIGKPASQIDQEVAVTHGGEGLVQAKLQYSVSLHRLTKGRGVH
jgi:hypothetical protein